MRQGQAGSFRIELQRMARLAVLLKGYALKVNSGRFRFMAGGAIEFLAARQSLNCFTREMERVVELQRVWVAALVRVQTKFRMIFCKAMNHVREAAPRTGRLKNIWIARDSGVERVVRQPRAFRRRRGHYVGSSMTESAVLIGGCRNRTMVFLMTMRT